MLIFALNYITLNYIQAIKLSYASCNNDVMLSRVAEQHRAEDMNRSSLMAPYK